MMIRFSFHCDRAHPFNAENIRERFAGATRRIDFGETGPRPIYAKAQKGLSLLQDGIAIVPLPPFPEEQN